MQNDASALAALIAAICDGLFIFMDCLRTNRAQQPGPAGPNEDVKDR